MAKKSALGKGIASLIQETPNQLLAKNLKESLDEGSSNGQKVQERSPEGPLLVPINLIEANPLQPRKIFKEEDLRDLSASIVENGIIQPLIVIRQGNGFELIAGERRLRAAKLAGLDKVPVVVKRASERDKLVMAIIENVQRSDLNCVEEALAYFQLMEDFKLSQEEVAKKVGKERSSVANFLRILKLPRQVIDLLQKEILSFGHGKVLASLKEREHIIRLANEVVEGQLSVRELEKLSKKRQAPDFSESKDQVFGTEKVDQFRRKLEQSTGFHFQLSTKNNGSGQVAIKFANEAEFNDIYEYLLRR